VLCQAQVAVDCYWVQVRAKGKQVCPLLVFNSTRHNIRTKEGQSSCVPHWSYSTVLLFNLLEIALQEKAARFSSFNLSANLSDLIWFQICKEIALIETAACYVLSLEEVRLSLTLTASQLPITVCKSHCEAKEPWHLLRLTVLYWWGFTLRVKSLLSIALLWHSVKWPIGTNNMKYSVSVTLTLPNPSTPSYIHNLCSNVSVHCNSY